MKKVVTYFLLLAALPHPASSQFNIRNSAQITTTGAPAPGCGGCFLFTCDANQQQRSAGKTDAREFPAGPEYHPDQPGWFTGRNVYRTT